MSDITLSVNGDDYDRTLLRELLHAACETYDRIGDQIEAGDDSAFNERFSNLGVAIHVLTKRLGLETSPHGSSWLTVAHVIRQLDEVTA